MSKFTAQQKRNRGNNSGGVAPDAQRIATTLAIALHRIHRKGDSDTVRKRKVVTFLTWWLTHELINSDNIAHLPTLTRVTGKAQCEAHTLRPVRTNNVTRVEYALCYLHKGGSEYLWQPIPDAFNALFVDALSSSSGALLTDKQHQALCEDLSRKWKTLGKLACYPRVRKDRLFRYWMHMGQSDSKLSTIAKSVMLPRHQDHHHQAKSYQRETSDQIRFKVFEAHNRYFKRITDAIRLYELTEFFGFVFKPETKKPDYLKHSGTIAQLERVQTNGTYVYKPIAPIVMGSDRALSVDDTRQFFHVLADSVSEAYRTVSTPEGLRHYYNLRTYQITFQFLILTGVRPTHAISIDASQCYDCRHAMVFDKGRYRTVWLCDFFSQALKAYLALQHVVCLHLSLTPNTLCLWYLLDENFKAQPLTAKTVRLAMQSFSPDASVVPYQLRHTFAQMALTATLPTLSTQLIDRLMGHSEFGEHLGNEHRFPASQHIAQDHLNRLAHQLGLDSPSTFRNTLNQSTSHTCEAHHEE
ncbi:site-specific integrase [Vibrio rarus]|uniref:site-specific integrase n=1 Tax=Vibrio rarus TaxID=413403 RepID=UPI0021C3B333|nr:site-specific integrase [Vibrio rarus]